MKKYFLLFSMMFGFMLAVQAQSMFVQVTNNTGDNWAYKVREAGGNFIHFAVPPIAPFSTVSGTVAAPVNMPLEWGGQDFDNGCSGASGFNIDIAVNPFGNQALCGYTVSWKLTQAAFAPFNYTLQVSIN